MAGLGADSFCGRDKGFQKVLDALREGIILASDRALRCRRRDEV